MKYYTLWTLIIYLKSSDLFLSNQTSTLAHIMSKTIPKSHVEGIPDVGELLTWPSNLTIQISPWHWHQVLHICVLIFSLENAKINFIQ